MSRDPLWETIFSTRAWGRYPSEDLIRFTAQRFYARQPRSQVQLLEVGFGTGANLWYFAREGFSVHGLEGSEAGTVQARQRLDLEVPGWNPAQEQRLRARDMCLALPWDANQFDAVIDCDAVTCVDHDSACKVYAEMHRVARPGGWLYVRTPAAGTWGDGSGEHCGHNAWRCEEGPFAGTGVVRFATEADLKALFAPWTVVSTEQVTRTLEGRSKVHTEWVVIARKDSV
jgi:SAM-dependent methyltransferase